MRYSRIAALAVVTLFSCTVRAFGGPSTDKITGLPLFPGSTIVDTQPARTSCGISMRGTQYGSDAAAASAVGFYRKALVGAKMWSVPAARMTEFLMPDGKASVRVLGTPAGIYIVYGSFSKPITMTQARQGPHCQGVPRNACGCRHRH